MLSEATFARLHHYYGHHEVTEVVDLLGRCWKCMAGSYSAVSQYHDINEWIATLFDETVLEMRNDMIIYGAHTAASMWAKAFSPNKNVNWLREGF